MRPDAMPMSSVSIPTRARTVWRAATALALAATLAGCTTPQKDSDSSTYMVLLTLQAAPGAEPDAMGTVLASDVQTAGTVYSDPAEATFQLASKDPGVSPTPVSYITVNKYRVRYTRTDGGVAPAGFESGATFTVTNAITSSGSFTLVRAQTKTVSPLAELVGQGGTHFVPVTAEVTFEGTDQNGRAVSVTGTIGINFADWADPGDSNPEPVTSFTVAPDTGLQAGQLAQFDASASTVAPGRTINTYAWDFGDGSDVVTGSGPLASHAFAAQGSYAVKLTVTDSAGQAYTVTRTVTVLP